MKALAKGLIAVALVTSATVITITTFNVAMAQEGAGDVVYVPTPQVVVDTMLTMAKVGPSDYVIDLGSGDGRMVITAAKKFGARGFGVDLDQVLLKLSNENAKQAGVTDRAQFFDRNIFETDLKQATVITTYLLPSMNERLRPAILDLKPGTRVVAHDYHMGEWQPDEHERLSVPEKVVGNPGVSYIYLWYVPARVAGRWRSEVPLSPAAGATAVPYDFNLTQIFQKIDGSVRVGSQDMKMLGAELRGDQISFTALSGRIDDKNTVRRDFRGKVNGDTITGTVRIEGGGSSRTVPWNAKLTQRGEMKQGAADTPAPAVRSAVAR
ncbi:MAG: SAM-dependent methyltransferase [Burkholderiales bacterium]